jgi:hypothetical protein
MCQLACYVFLPKPVGEVLTYLLWTRLWAGPTSGADTGTLLRQLQSWLRASSKLGI